MLALLTSDSSPVVKVTKSNEETRSRRSPKVTRTTDSSQANRSLPITAFIPTSTADKILNIDTIKTSVSSKTRIKTRIKTPTSSQLSNQSNLSSTDSSNESKPSLLPWIGIGIALVVIATIIVILCRKCGKKRKGTIRLKDETDSFETPRFESLSLGNNDLPLNDTVNSNNNDSPLVNITDSRDNDHEVVIQTPLVNTDSRGNDHEVIIQPPLTNTTYGYDENRVIIHSSSADITDSRDDNIVTINSNNPFISVTDSDDSDNKVVVGGDDDSNDDSRSNRIQSQPPMVQLSRISSTNLTIDYSSPFEDAYSVDGDPSRSEINDGSNDKPSTTIIHELEMEHQESSVDVSPMNRMTLSDYNDYNDVIQPEDYPSFESLFPNPPERVFPKK